MKRAAIYYDVPSPPHLRTQMVERFVERRTPFGSDRDAIRHWLRQIYTPADQSWLMICPGKSASSTTLSTMFQLQFGTPLNTKVASSQDINPDRVFHDLIETGIFRRMIEVEGSDTAFDTALRLCTVRDPTKRGISAFNYLCSTHDIASPWLLRERLRLSATTGFDWDKHSRTPDGFQRFLEYTQIECAAENGNIVNTHWRPQTRIICPTLYKPVLVGKTENLQPFFKAIADRLDRPAPQHEIPILNQQTSEGAHRYLSQSLVKKLLTDIYADDYHNFDYPTP
jgi:hypothetical protein